MGISRKKINIFLILQINSLIIGCSVGILEMCCNAWLILNLFLSIYKYLNPTLHCIKLMTEIKPRERRLYREQNKKHLTIISFA